MEMKGILFLAFLLVCLVGVNSYKSYQGHKVIKATLNEEQASMINKFNLDVWSGDGIASIGDATILVSPNDIITLEGYGISYTVINKNVGQEIEDERVRLLNRNVARSSVGAGASPFFDEYHPANEIVEFVQALAASFPSLVRYNPTIGSTVEGRPIPSIIVTGNKGGEKVKIYFQGGIHAREWISPATVLFIVENLVTLYGNDTAVTTLLDTIEFHVVPLLNVDGYVYTWTNERLWRKNRKLVTGTTYGVDLNRNYEGVSWCEFGASKEPASETYCGASPFSEPESKATSGYLLANGPFVSAIDYHSYSQLVLRAWGYTTEPPPDDAEQKIVGDGYADAIKNVSGLIYTSEPSWQLYYTTGTAQDYFKGFAGIKYAYTVELRPTGSPGFVLPPDQIVPTGEENWAAFKYFADATSH